MPATNAQGGGRAKRIRSRETSSNDAMGDEATEGRRRVGVSGLCPGWEGWAEVDAGGDGSGKAGVVVEAGGVE